MANPVKMATAQADPIKARGEAIEIDPARMRCPSHSGGRSQESESGNSTDTECQK